MDTTKIFPYVVPEDYFAMDFLPPELLASLPTTPEGFRLPLGHGLFAILVEDTQGTIRSLDAIDLEEANLQPKAAHELALQNLQAFAKANRQSKSFEQTGLQGPEGFPVIAWLGHWLVSSCCRLPGLHDWATKQLKVPEICVCVPQQSSMFVFPEGTPSFRIGMRQFVQKFCENQDKLVSFDWFSLKPEGIVPFEERP